MIFIGAIKGIGCAILVVLCLILLLNILSNNFRLSGVSPLLIVSFIVSVVLMSIYYNLKSSEKRILYTQTIIHSALSKLQDGYDNQAIMDYIDDHLPDFLTQQNPNQLLNSDLSTQLDRYVRTVVKSLRVGRYITLFIEIILQLLLLLIMKNKLKEYRNSGRRRINYMNRDYYE